MKKVILFLMIAFSLNAFSQTNVSITDNPLLSPYDTPYGVPPFDIIKTEHYLPAFREGIKEQENIIKQITSNSEEPTFENTMEALEFSDLLLSKVSGVFYNLTSANTNDEIQKIAREIAPELSAHRDNIKLNKELFARIKVLYDKREQLNLNTEQMRLLEETYKDFAKGGIGLSEEKQERLREINSEISVLRLTFGENLLAETNGFKLVIDNESDLEGLTPALIDAAYSAGKKAGMEGKWIFTLHNPSIMPFLQYSAKRELREKILKAYINRCNNGKDKDNNEIIVKIINLRIEKAQLLGYKNYAEFVLEDNMAKNPENVMTFLDKLWTPTLEKAKTEANELQALIDAEGENFKLEPWDWRYYAEKVRKEKYDLDDEMLKPYFELENVRNGVFMLANKLFGITFREVFNLPKYHEEVKTYEVLDESGKVFAIYFMDLYPRASKRGGAWMNNYRDQYVYNGENVIPIITNVCNFSRPTSTEPALLTFDEVETLFHEFGHALHGMLSKCQYRSLSGTSVPRDFVELSSQIMENWITEPEMLALYAKHYKTNEIIPDELVAKIKKSGTYGQGFATGEYLAASLLDMYYHSLDSKMTVSPSEFENKVFTEIKLIPEIVSRYRSTYFNHIFNSGYSAGYYSYIWAAVLDADAFELFKQNGIFDKTTAESYRKNILEKGGTEDPMVLYKRFRGAEPSIEPLLKKRGLE